MNENLVLSVVDVLIKKNVDNSGKTIIFIKDLFKIFKECFNASWSQKDFLPSDTNLYLMNLFERSCLFIYYMSKCIPNIHNTQAYFKIIGSCVMARYKIQIWNTNNTEIDLLLKMDNFPISIIENALNDISTDILEINGHIKVYDVIDLTLLAFST